MKATLSFCLHSIESHAFIFVISNGFGQRYDGENMATFTFEFEELPLVIANGIPAGQVNGCAELVFDRNGDWDVHSVCVEGYQTITQAERSAGKKPWIYVEAPAEIAWIIEQRLNNEWSHRVQEAVREAIEAEREAAAEYRAEMRREERMGL